MLTFAEKYCSAHKIEPEQFRIAVFCRVLYPRANRIKNLLKLIPGFFEADYEFIDGVGRITELWGFDGEEADFIQHPGNRRFLRRALRLRVSGRRLKSLAHAAFVAESRERVQG